MGLPSSSVTPLFISMYKDSKTLLMLLMKSSNLSTVALPGNKQTRKRGVGHGVLESFHPSSTQGTSTPDTGRGCSLLGERQCLVASFFLEYSEDKQTTDGGRCEGGGPGRCYLRPRRLLRASCLCSLPHGESPISTFSVSLDDTLRA
ncbi:hypothetical protein P7K49_023201 [Saguinus oedipus]|uniref:Uncharacterized protein n=1 Tax=Saguinus oedipus TaxID=9490 RepID=A0ABQ9ULV2_SAGOE|nr:hypothetical protein P7K49_023201 [Saguinus oedipus]